MQERLFKRGDIIGASKLDSVNGAGSQQIIAELQVKVNEKAEYAGIYTGEVFVDVITEIE